jgi:predicted PurR-regulated permease PerM
MNDYTLSLQRLAHFLIITCLLFAILIIAKGILVPIAFAILFTLMLKPIADWYERWLPGRVLSSFLTIFTFIIPIVCILAFFWWQSVGVFDEFSGIGAKLKQGFDIAFEWVNEQFNFTRQTSDQWLREHMEPLLSAPLGFIGQSITSTSVVVGSVALSILYTFFLLLYRTGIKKFFLIQFGDNTRNEAQRIIRETQRVTQGYLYGLLLVISILGVSSSIGMWIIGIDYPFFWGALAAFLAIIPYIGTFIGGFLPFIYAFASSDSIWTPIAVAGLFMGIQFIDNNFITPSVVGSSVKINPLAAILALIVGGAMWGVAGLILCIPVIAIMKKIFAQIPFLQPVSVLLSSDLYLKERIMERRFEDEKYRLVSFFKEEEPVAVVADETAQVATQTPVSATAEEQASANR